MSHKRGTLIVLVAAIIVLGLGAGVAQALPPAQQGSAAGLTIPYAGRLNDEAGLAVPDGDYAFTFALYDAASGGTLLWSEVQEGVVVQDGSFVASLGRVSPIPTALLTGGERWLEVAVRGPQAGSFTALSPRQALRSAAPAVEAGVGQAAPCPHDHWGETWSGTSAQASFGAYIAAVYGQADLWIGVMGESNTGMGVYGLSDAGDGVLGSSTDGPGVHGQSTTGAGGFFETDSDFYLDGDVELGGTVGKVAASRVIGAELYLLATGNVTVHMDADQPTSAGDHLFNIRNGNGFDVCWVNEGGDLTCSGTIGPLVETAEYGQRKINPVGSPEAWHEDFGRGTLVAGRAVVTIEPIFAQTVNLQDYHVFLTPLGECNGLYVMAKTATSFEVRELGGGTAGVSFDYRIVAKRLGYEDVRLAPVATPEGGE